MIPSQPIRVSAISALLRSILRSSGEPLWLPYTPYKRVASTAVARLSSVWVIACSNLSQVSLLYACGEVTSCDARGQHMYSCSIRDGSQGNVHYICVRKKVYKAEPTLALKPRGDVTRNLKQGYHWPPKRTRVRQKLFKKNNEHFTRKVPHLYSHRGS